VTNPRPFFEHSRKLRTARLLTEMESIYLDHNSTTPIHPAVAEIIHQYHLAGYVNPASQHQRGQQARRRLEQHRLSIARLLGAATTGMRTDQLVFTSGGTESNNLALLGIAAALVEESEAGKKQRPDSMRIAISSIEHPSLIGAAEQLARLGFEVVKLPVNATGVCEPDEVLPIIQQSGEASKPLRLVSLMLANNETGVLQPVKKIAQLCRQHGILIHTDAVQAVGKMTVNFRELDVDAMSFTAHKFSGPRGIGGLLLRPGIPLQPILFGGFQQMSLRPGTEDVSLVAGMDKALSLFDENPQSMEHVRSLRDELQLKIQTEIPEAVVVGADQPRVPPTLNIAFPGIDRQAFLMAADMAGLAVSTGSACASGSSEMSPVLMAMQLPEEVISGAIRISLGVSNTRAEIVEASRRIFNIINNLRPEL
jgi:cysteine desulfurase